MKIFSLVMKDLDSEGANYSREISEVDLTDADDARITVEDPDGALVIHLGSANYLDRYKVYIGHLQQWRQQFDKLESVDLRYDRQIVVNPDLGFAVVAVGLQRFGWHRIDAVGSDQGFDII